MSRRIYVSEQHLVNADEFDKFVQDKTKNGFTITETDDVPFAGINQKLVTIEKWNI